MKNWLLYAQTWIYHFSHGNPPLYQLDCQSLIFWWFWPWGIASQTHRHPKGGKICGNVEQKTKPYDPLAMYYGNRKGAGNPKLVPHRSVRWWAVNYRWPWAKHSDHSAEREVVQMARRQTETFDIFTQIFQDLMLFPVRLVSFFIFERCN